MKEESGKNREKRMKNNERDRRDRKEKKGKKRRQKRRRNIKRKEKKKVRKKSLSIMQLRSFANHLRIVFYLNKFSDTKKIASLKWSEWK